MTDVSASGYFGKGILVWEENMIIYKCAKDNEITKTSVCPICNGRSDVESTTIFWCKTCKVPIFDEKCACCGNTGEKLSTDLRPVFPEERLLIELVLDKPFEYMKSSVWNGAGNHYYVDGKRIKFSIRDLKQVDCNEIRKQLETYQNTSEFAESYDYFNKYIETFLQANKERYEFIYKEAVGYIKEKTDKFDITDMFVSFSGGKDSTVTADLVMRALQTPKILHIFGDTTLEFPETEEYVKRYKKEHPQTPIVSSRNKEKDFEELCKLVGPPSRVMRWCCTIFKTGAIQRKISTIFRNKNKILTFYGIRRSESSSRNKYERESKSPKITKQITISPIIDWLDFDVWLYILMTQIDFNHAYRLGYARVGCWCCPNNSVWSEFLSRIYMPKQSEHFRNILIDFARGIGKEDAEVYVDDGFWKARQGGNGVDYAKKALISFKPCALQENTFNYELTKPITEELYELFKPFGKLDFEMGNKRLGEVYIMNLKGQPVLKLQGRIGQKELKVSILDHRIAKARSIKAAEEKVKCQLTKYQMCMGCLACESVCKHDAIKIMQLAEDNISYKILDAKCVRCTECVGHFVGGCYMRKVLATKRE